MLVSTHSSHVHHVFTCHLLFLINILYDCQIHSDIELFPEDFSDRNVFLCFYDIKVSVRSYANIILRLFVLYAVHVMCNEIFVHI